MPTYEWRQPHLHAEIKRALLTDMERDMDNETEQANLRNISDWQRERRERVDAYAAVLAHLNAAAAAVPMGDGSGPPMFGEIGFLANAARGSLRRVLDEPNPFVERATGPDPALREAAASILRDAEEAGVGDWNAARMVDFYATVLGAERRSALARTIDVIRGEGA